MRKLVPHHLVGNAFLYLPEYNKFRYICGQYYRAFCFPTRKLHVPPTADHTERRWGTSDSQWKASPFRRKKKLIIPFLLTSTVTYHTVTYVTLLPITLLLIVLSPTIYCYILYCHLLPTVTHSYTVQSPWWTLIPERDSTISKTQYKTNQRQSR